VLDECLLEAAQAETPESSEQIAGVDDADLDEMSDDDLEAALLAELGEL
jgi:hypothetical protein